MTNNKMKMFTATKQIESITIHYNEKLDGGFVRQLEEYIVRVAKKMKGVDLKSPKEVKMVNVFIHPDPKMFNRMFNSAIEKRYYNGHRGMEDMYIIRDEEGNIHMASPRGKSATKVDTLSKILVVKILGEYMEESQKQKIQTVTREVYREKEIKVKREKEQKEKEEHEKKEAEEKEREEEEEKQRLEEEEKEKERLEEEARFEAELEEERLRQEEEEKQREQEELDNMITTQKDIEEVIAEEEKELPLWIVFGWQGYVKGKLKTVSSIEKFSKYMNRKGYVKAKNVTEEADQEYAVIQVKYIIETYGFKKFKEVLRNPDNIYEILHTSKYNFERAVKAYTFKNYSEGEMKLEIDKAQNEGKFTDITIICEASDGSYILPEDNEIKKIKE